MLAQDRTAQFSPRAILIAIAAVAVVVVALAAALAFRLTTTSSVAAPQAPTAVHSQVFTSGSSDSCIHVSHHKGC
jgi:anti-sigma-K factor RskA